MNQFMGVALTVLEKEDQAFLVRLALEAREANAHLESSPTNLEDILSFAVMGDRLGLYNDEEGKRTPRLREILRTIYGEQLLGERSNYLDQFSDVSRKLNLKELSAGSNVSFITTNYDINIESALFYSGMIAQMPFRVNRHESPYLTNEFLSVGPLDERAPSSLRVPVFKLHGSVNWFEKGRDVTVLDQVVRSNHDNSLIPVSRLRRRELGELDGEPLIIPPTFLKPDVGGTLACVWAGAAKILNTAERLVFIGYSFPPTDIEMKYFLARSLGGNGRLRSIEIWDIHADDIVNRLQGDESGFGSHFKQLLEPVPGDWTKGGAIDYSRP